MKAMKLFYVVVAGVAALGLVLMGLAFVISGFDPAVGQLKIDRGNVWMGGMLVDNAVDIAGLDWFVQGSEANQGVAVNLGPIGDEEDQAH